MVPLLDNKSGTKILSSASYKSKAYLFLIFKVHNKRLRLFKLIKRASYFFNILISFSFKEIVSTLRPFISSNTFIKASPYFSINSVPSPGIYANSFL